MIGNLVGEHDSICAMQMMRSGSDKRVWDTLRVSFNRGVIYYIDTHSLKITDIDGAPNADRRDLDLMRDIIDKNIK